MFQYVIKCGVCNKNPCKYSIEILHTEVTMLCEKCNDDLVEKIEQMKLDSLNKLELLKD